MKLGSAWRKSRGGSRLWEKGAIWESCACECECFSECISAISLEIQLLPLGGCSFLCSLRFMSKQDNSSSGCVFFPPFLGSLHTNPGTIHSFCDRKMRSLCDVALCYMQAAWRVRFRGWGGARLPGFDGRWDTVQSEQGKKKRWLKGNFEAATYHFIQTFSVLAPRRWS